MPSSTSVQSARWGPGVGLPDVQVGQLGCGPRVWPSIALPRQTGSAARVHSCRGWEGPSRRAGQGWSFTGPTGWAWGWQEAGPQDLGRA